MPVFHFANNAPKTGTETERENIKDEIFGCFNVSIDGPVNTGSSVGSQPIRIGFEPRALHSKKLLITAHHNLT